MKQMSNRKRGCAMSIAALRVVFIVLLVGAPRFIWANVSSPISNQIMKFDSILAKNPKDVNALLKLGQAYRKIGITEEAERFYEKAFTVDPGNCTVNFALGELALEKGEYEQARIMFGKCAAIDTKNVDCLNALAEISLMIDKDKSSAKKYYDKVLAVDPRNEKALLNSGVLRIEQGDTSSAVAFLERYVTAYPDSVRGRMNLGILYDKTNRFHDALVQFTKILTTDSMHIEALQSLGVLYFKRKVYVESNAIFERVQKIRHSIPVSIGLALGYHYEKEPEKALSVLENTLLKTKEDAYMLRLLMADISFVAGRHEAAIEYCKMAHELKGEKHVEQEIVNAVYQTRGMNASVLLHDESMPSEIPLYKPGSIIKIFRQGLGD